MRSSLAAALLVVCVACQWGREGSLPSIEFTRVPAASAGGPDVTATLAGRVRGAGPQQRVVLYTQSEVWWVQPFADRPFTAVAPDGSWTSEVHLGGVYAALLVDPGFEPPPTTAELPTGGVVASAIVAGAAAGAAAAPRVLQWSGYEWRARAVSSDRGGRSNAYAPDNAWIDSDGALHLRISTAESGWRCSEVTLDRPFGYGTYVFVVRDTAHLDPRSVLSLFTWDPLAVEERHREMNIELSRWGDPENKSAQYVVQPYFVPVNVSRFAAPTGVLTHKLRWEEGRALFRTVRGRAGRDGGEEVADHEFTSGVPKAGAETVNLSFYVFGSFDAARPIDDEVVVESFEFLP